MRSGSPAGATRSSTCQIAVSCHGTFLSIEVGEHRPRRAAAADGEGETAARGDRGARLLGDELRAAPRDCVGVGQNLELHYEAGFSSCPPNCLRIAESTLSANSSSPRELKRE